MDKRAYFHLPGLFEHYELYRKFLMLFRDHREYFYDWCKIGSIYGAPQDCLWGGGRVECGIHNSKEIHDLMIEYDVSARLTFSNSLITEEHLSDRSCNNLCREFEAGTGPKNGIIVYSDLLLNYLHEKYPKFYFVSSTTKVITDFEGLIAELNRDEFRYVVPDFRLNKRLDKLAVLTPDQRAKVEFLCNECCDFGCMDRKACYEDVSRKNMGIESANHICSSPGGSEGYLFSKAMSNPGFIGVEDIQNTYIPMGFTNFKIEGRGLGSAMVLEFLLYYLTKPEYHIHVREQVYLDSMLDLF